ncbi:MAG: pyruvate kinase [Candidatus Dojkabacteria bacterium]|nr:pyruvate kinase [Candidatus Dojkabacteria bacterium]
MVKKTKIVATIGPASWDTKIIEGMLNNGLNVARINASFADQAELERVSKALRKFSKSIAVMMDTKGHKIRINDFGKDKKLKTGQKLLLFTEQKAGEIFLVTESSVGLDQQIPKESVILIDDGLIKLKVENKKGKTLECKVLQGGMLKRSKSVNIPGVHIEFGELSKKDYEDISYARDAGFDFVAASFIRNVNDLKAVEKLLVGSNTKVIAKIEDMEGVSNFDDILAEAEGIMIARGDLGVEIPAEKVPLIQKRFIEKCNLLGKPVIVATQMLQSMTENITPTRAEVNDVANAIFDGTDAVMLSAETSTGRYPVEAVATMSRIALEIEKSVEPIVRDVSPLAKPTTNAIAKAVKDSCDTLPIDKILVATSTGTTARTIARFRPKQPIIAFTDDIFSKRKLALSRGIIPDILEESSSTRDVGVQSLVRNALNKGYVSESDLILVVAGANIMGQSETNMLEINRVEQIIS